jgi:hypothetical protein
MEAALGREGIGGNLGLMFDGRRPSHEITRLIDRIRELVAEQRRLSATSELREARRLEIARLQRRLAILVKRELTS